MNNIFVFLGVALALASVTSLSTTSAPVLATDITELCQDVKDKPAKATAVYDAFLKKLNNDPKFDKTFTNTLNYLNNSTNIEEFLAGGPKCIQFFAGLKAPLLADYEAIGSSSTPPPAKLTHRIADIVAKLKAAIEAR